MFTPYEFVVEQSEPTESDFVVRFLGPLHAAARKVAKALTSLRLGKGRYRMVECKVPIDGQPGQTQSFFPCFNMNNNNATLRREAAGRQLKATVQPFLGASVAASGQAVLGLD
jgi:hypothetical protein